MSSRKSIFAIRNLCQEVIMHQVSASSICAASFSRHQMNGIHCLEPCMLCRWWCIPAITNNNPQVSFYLCPPVCLECFLPAKVADSQVTHRSKWVLERNTGSFKKLILDPLLSYDNGWILHLGIWKSILGLRQKDASLATGLHMYVEFPYAC